MNKNNKTGLVPKLRFPEFESTVEWKKSKIGEVFYNRQESGFVSLPLMSLTEEHGIIPQTNSNKKDTSNSDKTKYLRICIGDVVYNTMRMWQGRCAYSNVEGIVSPAYTVCTPQSGNNGLFFYYYFKTFNMIKKFHANSQGLVNDTLSLKYDAFSQIPIAHPLGDEQQKITDCLSSLDDLIAAENKKLEALRVHKKGLMQKLFPAKGKTVPEWRFSEFRNSGEWDKRPLKEIFNIFQGFAFSSSDSVNDGVRWLKIADVSIQRMNYGAPSYLPIEYKKLYEDYLVKQGDCVIALTGPILNGLLKMAMIDKVFEGALLNQRVGKLVTNQNSFFVYCLLQTPKIINDIEKNISGSAPPNLSTRQIEDINTYIPSISEQQKIADCLSSIDDLIAAQIKRIDSLQLHKKGLMQGLFPSIEEVGE